MNYASFTSHKNVPRTTKISTQMKVVSNQVPEPRHAYFNNLTNSVWFALRPGPKGQFNTYLGEV